MSFFTRFIENLRGRTAYINSSDARSAPRIGNVETDEICQAILDCNATHVSRGRVVHVKKDSAGRIVEMKRTSEYTKLFARPNPMMTRQDFLYAMAWNVQITNTAFAWIKWDQAMHPVEIWPLVYMDFRVVELVGGIGVEITDTDGQRYTVSLEDLVVIRQKYDGRGYRGTDNTAIRSTLGVVQSLDDALNEAAAVSNKVRGIIKQKNAMLATKSAEQTQKEFTDRMKQAAKEGGFVSVDATEDFSPLNITTWAADAELQKQVYKRIYTYWRTPQDVVDGTASEQVMQNYNDAKIEPLWEEMGEAFTQACFTRREQDFGNELIIYSGQLMGASWQTKLNVIAETKEQGLLTVNEQREILGYGPTEDGDDRLVSLNYIKSTDQSKYQTGDNDGT